MSNETSKATGRPWHVNAVMNGRIIGDETVDRWDKLMIHGPNSTVATVYHAADARLIADRVNGWEALEAERDRLLAALAAIVGMSAAAHDALHENSEDRAAVGRIFDAASAALEGRGA